jgi:hypothetical protein
MTQNDVNMVNGEHIHRKLKLSDGCFLYTTGSGHVYLDSDPENETDDFAVHWIGQFNLKLTYDDDALIVLVNRVRNKTFPAFPIWGEKHES